MEKPAKKRRLFDELMEAVEDIKRMFPDTLQRLKQLAA